MLWCPQCLRQQAERAAAEKAQAEEAWKLRVVALAAEALPALQSRPALLIAEVKEEWRFRSGGHGYGSGESFYTLTREMGRGWPIVHGSATDFDGVRSTATIVMLEDGQLWWLARQVLIGRQTKSILGKPRERERRTTVNGPFFIEDGVLARMWSSGAYKDAKERLEEALTKIIEGS